MKDNENLALQVSFSSSSQIDKFAGLTRLNLTVEVGA